MSPWRGAPPSCLDVAIVGDGTAAVALLAALDARDRPWRIAVIGRADDLGRGRCYREDAACLRMNTPASSLSIRGDDPRHFVRWLARHGGGAPNSFVSRSRFGAYLAQTGRALLQRGERCLIEGRADRIVAEREHVVVTGSDGLEVCARSVVLATGIPRSPPLSGLPPAGDVFDSPFPTARLLAQIPRDARVLILGTSLSALDAAVALREGGHAGPIHLASRSGRLPAVRAPRTPCRFAHTRCVDLVRRAATGGLGLRDILRPVRRDLRAVGFDWTELFRRGPPDTPERFHARRLEATQEVRWLTVLNALQEELDPAWAHLRDDERALLIQRFVPDLLHKLSAIPPINAERLDALLCSGSVTVHGGLLGVHRAPGGPCATFRDDPSLVADALIDATGIPRRLTGALYASLLEAGRARALDSGGIDACPTTGRLLDADGRLDPRLYALGHPTCGIHPVINNVAAIVARARELVVSLSDTHATP